MADLVGWRQFKVGRCIADEDDGVVMVGGGWWVIPIGFQPLPADGTGRRKHLIKRS